MDFFFFSCMKRIAKIGGKVSDEHFRKCQPPQVEMLLMCDFAGKKTAFDAICSLGPNPDCNSN